MNPYLVIVKGSDVDQRFVLEKDSENRIGRGSDCQIPLADPLSSRVHAKVVWLRNSWVLKDCGSRNGTIVNGNKVDELELVDSFRIRIGNTELRFTDESVRDIATEDAPFTQTLVQNTPMTNSQGFASAFTALQDRRRRQDLLDLYQLCYRFLSMDGSDALAEMGLEVIQARTDASVVGLLWSGPNGQLRPQMTIPSNREAQIKLGQKLTDMVCRDSTAIWVKNERVPSDGKMKHVADAICVPLLEDGKTIGAIHVYRENEKFEEHDFDFVMSASSILGTALLRAQHQVALQTSNDRLVAKNADFNNILGNSRPMKELKERIARVGHANGSVLVRGESGSGKELVARAIHQSSPRKHRPLLCVNCAAMPAELMESQLFGHKKGAFTGADKDHAGWFQQADTGTLFLDEVGELSLDGQAKLLRVLEGHPFLPVGSNREVRVDVRVVAATNRDLKELVREKRFREDLFYRLGVFELWIPPLRQRDGDVEMLVEYFLNHFKKQRARQSLQLTTEAKRKLIEYHWPGNVRQLRNVIDSAVVLAVGDEIKASDLGLHDLKQSKFDSLNIEEWEKRLIQEALERTQGSMPEAAELLGISRATLYRKIETYKIDRSESA